MDYKEHARQLEKVIASYGHLLIAIKGSPDPDAMASAFALKEICSSTNTTALIDSPIYPSLAQNLKIVKNLHLPISFQDFSKNVKLCDAYAVLDHPSVFVEGVTGVIPCAIHIDHHQMVKEDYPVDFRLLSDETGSSSSMLALLIRELEKTLKWNSRQMAKVATALFFGIKTDTNDFQYATIVDQQAIEYIQSHVDMELINDISSRSFSKAALAILNQAIQNQIIQKRWLISGIGYLDKRQRDIMAITADFLLRREDVDYVVVFAIIRSKKTITLEASVRTSDESFNLNRFIKKISHMGGARKFKGAFQVTLDYFRYCKDEDLLWQLVYSTTMEALKEHTRITFSKTARSLYRKLFNRIVRLFRDRKSG